MIWQYAIAVVCLAVGAGLFSRKYRPSGSMFAVAALLFAISTYLDYGLAFGAMVFLLLFMGILGAVEAVPTRVAYAVGFATFGLLVAGTIYAPDFVSSPDRSMRAVLPSLGGPLFGTDMAGVPLLEYALQGAAIVTGPAVLSGLVVGLFATIAGVSRCAAIPYADEALQAFSELVGALPRLVVILVVALASPPSWRDSYGLYLIGVTWAILAAPGAMDEAAATAGRLGGSKFVEALRAHGFTAYRIYVVHIIWFNLRPVVVRQAAEVGMQVIFLEIALSYLAESQRQPSFTHADSSFSWARLLYDGYSAIVGGQPLFHALALGITLVALTAVMAQAFRLGARAR